MNMMPPMARLAFRLRFVHDGCMRALLVAMLASCVAPVAAQTIAERYEALIANTAGLDDTERLTQLFELQWEYELAEYPETATYAGISGYNDRWTDRSLAAVARRKRELVRPLTVLRSIERNGLPEAERLDYDLFAYSAEVALEGARFPSELLPIDQLNGEHISLPQVLAIAPRRNRDDFEDILARLDAVPAAVDQWIALLRQGLERDVTQPAIALRDVPGQVRDLMAADLQENVFFAPFEAIPSRVVADEAEELRRRGAAAVRDKVIPAYRRLYDYLTETYIPSVRDEIAWAALPDGEAWYRHAVRSHTTTELPPREIHEIGLAEVDRIRAEMDAVIERSEFTGDFEEFIEFLRTDDRFYYDSADALLTGYRDIAKRIDPALMRLFGTLPRMTYGVSPIPDYNAPSETTARYRPGSLDAGRPGTFLANTYDLRSRPKWEMEALTLHEAVPGHHLQLALQQELGDIPEFRRHGGYTAFIEGWGLYAESLGDELGLYQDPYSKFGQLTYEMWRAVRLVVDTGMHAMGWSRDDAIRFFMANSSKPEHDITVEIDRYIVWPGQALAYKLGELEFKELRSAAADALGDRFDVRAFHDALLSEGALPLDVLEARMSDWIEQRH
jgi:uncharacterized protein (DUF885 family)